MKKLLVKTLIAAAAAASGLVGHAVDARSIFPSLTE